MLMVEAFDAVQCVARSLFMRGVCLAVVPVRHISHGDAFKVRGLANVVLFVLVQNNALQSLGLIYGHGKS